nr:MAG TPA: hypothetical protein [Caudoviricetes sp.]
MKIFSYEKYKRAKKADSTWARESDGRIVRDGGILGTDYICSGDNVDAWCIDYTLKPGDKVRIANKRGTNWNPEGQMDKYMGKVMTVDSIDWSGIHLKEAKGDRGITGIEWNFKEEDFVKVLTAFDHAEPEKTDYHVELHFCERKTTAMLVKDADIVKTAVARCHPADEYDRGEDAKIAVNRLFVPAQYYNGKVVCIASGYNWWTVGKVYNVVDGVITDDGGYKYPKFGAPYKDAEDVKHAGCRICGRDDRHNRENTFVPLIEG